MPEKRSPEQDAVWWRAQAQMHAEAGDLESACEAMAEAFRLEAPSAPPEVIRAAVAGYRRGLDDVIRPAPP